MNSVPLIPKPRTLPNLDALPVIRDLFQDEFQSALQQGSSRNLTKTILTSLQYNSKPSGDEKELFARSDPADIATLKRENLLSYSKNIFQAYLEYDKELENITEAEKNVFEANVASLKREATTLENKALQELFLLKRQPLMKALDMKYVRKYKLLQSEAGLPPSYKADSDFRVQNFVKWKKRLESISQDSVIGNYMTRSPKTVAEIHPKPCSSLKSNEFHAEVKKIRKPRPKRAKSKPEKEIFRAEPKIVFFTDYSPGEVYTADIQVKNIHFKGVEFQIKPMSPDGPFFVYVKNEMTTKKLYPGLSFQLTVEFCPKSLDVIAEDIYIVTEDGKKLLIPLVAYLEPPILKTHRDIDELTKSTVEKIASSCIECGACFTGDTKVTKLKFKCFRGSGEYFVMSSENWNRTCVDSVTNENLLEIPPFRVYPVYFKMDKNEVIDLYVEFSPKQSGTHVENVVVACDNGEIRSLDLLGDAIGWHSYFFSFQDDLLKEIPVDKDDDVKVKYYIDFKDTAPSGEVEKNFAISNNSGMSFEFQWKIREANIASVRNKYLKLGKFQVKIKPESGTLHANSICEFNVKIVFDNAEIGDYRMVLSLYVLNLPYQCIEEDNTVIQPTGLVRNLYSQSLYGEEEFTTPSPELLSLQGTYESLQDSIKSYVEYQTKAQAFPKTDFCRTTCIPNPGLCAKPLKKSKTYFNIGDEEGLSCICRGRTEESNSESCTSNDKTTESSVPRNDIVWDFVDILVDEVELWVEVTPLKITVEPCVLDFSNSLVTNSPPEFKEVRLTNHSQSPARCFWTRLNEQLNGNASSVSLYHNSHLTDPTSESSKRSTQNSDLNSERTSQGKVEKFHEKLKDTCGTEFVVPGWSSCVCCIGVSANKPGNFNETVILNVHGSDLQCRVLVQGTITVKYLSVTPHTLNFRFVKQGTRFMKEYSVKNEYSEPLQLNINQYHIDHSEINYLDSGTGNRGSCEIDKFSLGGGETVSRVHYLDARVPGLKVSLLEIKTDEPVVDCESSQYVMIVSDVRVPSLHIYTKRFGNAILAPSGMMYVGKKVTCSITLKNKGHLNTAFVWGHPFGCHSRKIKLDIQPKNGTVKKQEKLTLSISLTPLDEGIINHCYVPCFFCRSSAPVLLSVVGIIEKMNVTFEIIGCNENGPLGREQRTSPLVPPYGTVCRIHWPIKLYDPNLGQGFIGETDILEKQCWCNELEKMAQQVFNSSESKSGCQVSEKYLQRNRSTERTSTEKSKECLPGKKSKTVGEYNYHESDSCGSLTSDKKQVESNSLRKFRSHESLSEDAQLLKSELEFLNVSFGNPVTREFVIRNETPIPSQFRIQVKNFGEKDDTERNRISAIKEKIFGRGKDKMWQKEQPILIVATPSEGDLLGYEGVCVKVVVSGNTWGEYRDCLICQIQGIEPFNLNVFVRFVGHPFHFPMFENHSMEKPVLRFQPISYLSDPAFTKIRVVNRCSIPITISWLIVLTQPLLKEDEHEESFNLCVDSNANLDSNHSEESTKSVKVYLPKNMSESSSTFRNMLEMRDFSQNSGTMESFGKGETFSEKNENQELTEPDEKFRQDSLVPSPTEDIKSQQYLFRIDIHNFQVEPKEIFFEPFEEKKIIITFDSRFCRTKASYQEFKAVLTGCVKLKPTDERSPGLYYRPCGMKFLSDILDLNAVVETPVVSFEVLKGDLRFYVDANDVINSKTKKQTISRVFFLKNNGQKSIPLKIEISPGSIFNVSKVETIDEFHEKYDPDVNQLKVETGQFLKVELECAVTYKGVIYAYEQLKLNRRKESNPTESDDVKTIQSTEEEETTIGKDRGDRDQPWFRYFNNLPRDTTTAGNSSLEARDSFKINLNRMSSRSDHSICYDYSEPSCYPEAEGEFMHLPFVAESPCRTKILQHVIVVEEEISFVQPGLLTQRITAELHLSFPALRLSPKTLDMGNVYIGETSIRYCSLINLTGTPTDFKAKSKCNVNEFVLTPLTGNLPSVNYNSDVGKTVTVQFKPLQPGYFLEVFQIYCNQTMEFDCHELTVTGHGTWNEKYKQIKFESGTRLPGISRDL